MSDLNLCQKLVPKHDSPLGLLLTHTENIAGSTMLILLSSSLALVSYLSRGMQRKQKLLEHSVFIFFIMHPVSYFHCANPYLALWRFSLNLQMQAAEAGWGKTAQ